MFEKVNPSHPDKIADRIAGAIVDLAYSKEEDPKIAVEVLIGHSECSIIIESNLTFEEAEIINIVKRISNSLILKYNIKQVPQDVYLADNQKVEISCGDNGIFKGTPITLEQKQLTNIANYIYEKFPYDGKYLINQNKVTICQAKCNGYKFDEYNNIFDLTVNPLGDWEGGINVDCGATNRKLGSDMGDAVTGGGLHGKDLSKADVTVNIYAFLKANEENEIKKYICNIGDKEISGVPYKLMVNIAKEYIRRIGGFEKFAEWGLIRP